MKIKYISMEDTGFSSLDGYLERYSILYESAEGGLPRMIGKVDGERLISKAKVGPVTENAVGVMPIFKQTIRLESSKDIDSISEWEDIVNSYFRHLPSLYRNTTVYLPDYDTPRTEENYKGELFGNIHSYYNFKSKIYEQYTISSDADEVELPAHIVGLYQKSYPDSILAKTMLSLDEIADSNYKMTTKISDSVNNNSKMFIYNNGTELDNNYFYIKAKGYLQENAQISLMPLTIKTFVGFELPADTSRTVYDVPFYNSIRMPFDIDTVKDFTKVIIDMGMQEILLKSIDITTAEREDFNINANETGMNSGPVNQYLNNWEAYNLFSNVDIEQIMEARDREAFLYDENTSILKYDNPDVIYNVTKAILTAELNKFFKRQNFNFTSIMLSKEKCYNELLAYKVTKTPSSVNSSEQVFYFFNHGGVKEFIDSQVKFSETYRYSITAMYLVVGTEYVSEIINVEKGTNQNKPMTAEVEFTFKPDIRIFEVPVYNKELRIVEPPPLEPIVSFRNSKYIRNKIEIDLDERHGVTTSVYDRKPLVTIEEDDVIYSNRLEQYMGNEFNYYSHVASGKTYEIYRLETKPKKLSDFRGNLYYLLENQEVDKYNNKTRSLLTFVDFLQHDKTYYYMFRALTHNGNPSNPSPVYEIEKTRDSDETFLKVNIIDLEEKEEYSMETSFRRFMNITIRDEHLNINDRTYNSENNSPYQTANQAKLIMGDDELEDAIWNYNDVNNNYIKLRLESKNTGKKIDLNLIFNYNQPKNDN